jgi:hypothetical protein
MNNSIHPARVVAEALALAACFLSAAGLLAPSALADGDPASDVLATQPLFLPQDAGVNPQQQVQLTGLLQAAGRAGYAIRVALIASRSDLGSVTELWRQPQTYAEFLGQELSLVYRGPLLVIMPNGFGFMWPGHSTAVGHSVLMGMRIPASGPGLGTTAASAVQRLAHAAGYSISAPVSQLARSVPGSSDTTAWIAFALGGLLMAVAWAASLRARPLRLRDKQASG